jgi:acetyltransferase-like isoleucine patch superfamily enzyme
MGVSDRLQDTVALLRNTYNRRNGMGFVNRDLGVLRRLQRAGRVTMGRGTYGVPTVFTHNWVGSCLHIGNYSSVDGIYLLGGGHPPDRVTTFPLRIHFGLEGAGEDGFPAHSKDTFVGSDVYVGWRAVVLSGVTIGDGAIIGTGALVTKDVPPYAIVGGNPAKIIRYRYSEPEIAALLEIRWWDWPDEEIKAAAPLLAGADLNAFIEYARERFPAKPARVS